MDFFCNIYQKILGKNHFYEYLFLVYYSYMLKGASSHNSLYFPPSLFWVDFQLIISTFNYVTISFF